MLTTNSFEGLIERLYWFVKLRWVAIVGLAGTFIFTDKVLGIGLPLRSLLTIAGIMVGYNIIFSYKIKQLRKKPPENLDRVANIIANLQMSFDLVCLAGLIHFSGGIENPFIFYFIFHIIIASILLPRAQAFLQATLAVLLLCFVVMLEYFDVLQHYCLEKFIGGCLDKTLIYVAGVSFVFISAFYIAAYMTTSIAKRLREREKNLEEANILLTEKDRIKGEYVLRVSHDIKEHLAAIQSCIDPVTEGITGPLNDKQMNLLKRAVGRTEKLLFFVKALLELTRMKLKKELRMESFSLKHALSEAIDYVSAKAKIRNISLNISIAPGIDKIKGVEAYIQETFVTILANAIKYTPANGRVDVILKDRNESVLIEVKDTGIGIPEEDKARIFEEFYRASNAKKLEKDGTGLGLSIAKQVVGRHKGKIWVESQEGVGSTFSIILPKEI